MVAVAVFLIKRRKKKQSMSVSETVRKRPDGYEVHGASAPQEVPDTCRSRVHEMPG